MREHCEKFGRERPPDVVLGSLTSPGEKPEAAALIDKIGRFRELGVSGAAVHVEGCTRAQWCDNAERYGAEVLSKLDR